MNIWKTLFVSIVFSSSNALASEFLFFSAPEVMISRTIGVSLAEAGQTYAQYLKAFRQQQAKDQNLKKYWEQVILAEQEGDNQRLFQHCSELIKNRYDFDWPADERKWIRSCLSKLAQLSLLPQHQTAFQWESQQFADGGKKVKIPERIRSRFEWVLINGKEFPTGDGFVRLSPGKFRISLFSSSHHPVSDFIDEGELDSYDPQTSNLVHGNCQEGLRLMPIYFKKRDVRIKAIGVNCVHEILEPKESPATQMQMATPAPAKLNQRKAHWLWWGLGGLAAAVILNQNAEKKSNTQTATRGF